MIPIIEDKYSTTAGTTEALEKGWLAFESASVESAAPAWREPDAELKFAVYGQRLEAYVSGTLVSDTIGYLTAEFVFSREWHGLDKWMHLTDESGRTFDVELVDDEAEGLALGAGRWTVWVHGHEIVAGTPAVRITTSKVTFRVIESGVEGGAPLPQILPTAEEQIAANAANALREARRAREMVGRLDIRVEETEAGAVVTANSDLSGRTQVTLRHGEPGYTPKKGVDYFDGEPGYTPKKGVDYFDGEPGYTPVKGKDYFDGEPGYTPVKGKDYFDGEPGYTPVKGKDYWTDADKSEIVEDVLAQVPENEGAGAFWITVAGSASRGWRTTDKTLEELFEALNAGQDCWVKYSSLVYACTYKTPSEAHFGYCGLFDWGDGTYDMVAELFVITRDGIQAFHQTAPQLAITGTAGDFVVIGEDGKPTTKTIPIYGGETA